MIPFGRSWLRRVRCAAVVVGMAMAIAGCGALSRTPPAPTPAPFPGIAGQLTQHGIHVTGIVSGDAGSADENLPKTAVGFHAAGPDPAAPVRGLISIFDH